MEADADGWLSLLVSSPPLAQWAEMVQNLLCHSANNKQTTNNSTTTNNTATSSTGKTGADNWRKALIFFKPLFILINCPKSNLFSTPTLIENLNCDIKHYCHFLSTNIHMYRIFRILQLLNW